MSKQQLTIEHLALYLPYGVKCWVKDYAEIGKEPVNNEYTLNAVYSDGSCVFYDLVESSQGFKDVKPVLRPLSDLDKLEGGINSHSINQMLEKDFGLEYGVFSHYKNELTIDIDGDSSLGYDQNISIPFMVIEAIRVELLKGHYDIFGLIEKGLALNLNDLKDE